MSLCSELWPFCSFIPHSVSWLMDMVNGTHESRQTFLFECLSSVNEERSALSQWMKHFPGCAKDCGWTQPEKHTGFSCCKMRADAAGHNFWLSAFVLGQSFSCILNSVVFWVLVSRDVLTWRENAFAWCYVPLVVKSGNYFVTTTRPKLGMGRHPGLFCTDTSQTQWKPL